MRASKRYVLNIRTKGEPTRTRHFPTRESRDEALATGYLYGYRLGEVELHDPDGYRVKVTRPEPGGQGRE